MQDPYDVTRKHHYPTDGHLTQPVRLGNLPKSLNHVTVVYLQA